MPEFEETSSASNPSHNYTPSADAKPRTRRRSGGFKKEYDNAPKGSMGEVDPIDALQSEKLSGGSDAPAIDQPKPEQAERKERTPRQKRAPRNDDSPRGTPEPSEATLASIKKVESRIAERKAERDARYEERKKARSTEKKDSAASKPVSKKPATKPRATPKQPTAKKKGLIATLLSMLGLGLKETPVKKSGANRSNSQQNGRPQAKSGKGGNRSGQGRRGGNRSSQGRRGGNRGNQNRRRRPQAARSE